MVFSKVKANLGLDKAEHLFTGAAPISKEVRSYVMFRTARVRKLNNDSAWSRVTSGKTVLRGE